MYLKSGPPDLFKGGVLTLSFEKWLGNFKVFDYEMHINQ